MKQKHFIDIHKGATAPFVLLLMYLLNQWDNTTAWIYLALHGSYGLMWILKSKIFPDNSWEQTCSIWYGLYIWSGLSLYWISPWIILTGYFNSGIPLATSPHYLGMCIFMFSIGVFFHFSADMQKHSYLKLKPGVLITDGMMKRCRNTNYFGELLIYLGFGLLAQHWIPLVALAFFIMIIWIPNMRQKEKSLSRYTEFEDYKNNSSFIFPFIF